MTDSGRRTGYAACSLPSFRWREREDGNTMAKFCGKCGAKLDEVTGLCPNCDVNKSIKKSAGQDRLSEPLRKVTTDNEIFEDSLTKKHSPKATRQRTQATEQASGPARHELRRFTVKAVSVLVLILLLLIGGICGLSYCGVIQNPTITSFMEKLGLNHESDIVSLCEKFCKDYDVLSENDDGTYTVEVVAPDVAGIFIQEMQNNPGKALDAESINTWMGEHTDLQKRYELTVASKESDDIQQAFFQQISYDLMVSAIMETYIVEPQLQEAAE